MIFSECKKESSGAKKRGPFRLLLNVVESLLVVVIIVIIIIKIKLFFIFCGVWCILTKSNVSFVVWQHCKKKHSSFEKNSPNL